MFNKIITAGFIYYGSVGPLNHFMPVESQQHQLFAVLNLNLSLNWEFNCGYGWGFTKSTDNDMFKLILGYRIH